MPERGDRGRECGSEISEEEAQLFWEGVKLSHLVQYSVFSSPQSEEDEDEEVEKWNHLSIWQLN